MEARASYLHVRHVELPRALAELHRALAVEARVHLVVARAPVEGSVVDGPVADRAHDSVDRLLVGAGFGVESIEVDVEQPDRLHVVAHRRRTLADTVGPGMRLLLCGLNPSVRAADAGVGFVTPGNRFWPAALAAGLLTRDRDAFHALDQHRVGMTDLAKRATARADELTADEYRAGAERVERLVEWLRPGAICFVGLSGYRTAVDRGARSGVQPDRFGGAAAYVMPNPSGLNARATPAELATHLRAAADLADA